MRAFFFTSKSKGSRKSRTFAFMKKVKHNYVGEKYHTRTIISFSHTIRRISQSGKTKGRRSTINYWNWECECGATGTSDIWGLKKRYCFSCKDRSDRSTWEYSRKLWSQTPMQDVRSSYMLRARKKKIEFDISGEKFWELTQSNCYYCDDEPKQVFKAIQRANKWTGCKDFTFNGLDRIDSSKGYVLGNVVTCCKKCNYAKNDMSQKEFFEHLQKIIKNIQGEKLDRVE